MVNITNNSVGVKIEEPTENNVIKHYDAFVKGGTPEQACSVQANADTLLCTISGISPSHEYTVGVKACVRGDNGCGSPLEKSFRTELMLHAIPTELCYFDHKIQENIVVLNPFFSFPFKN